MKKAVFLIFLVFAFTSCNRVLTFHMDVLRAGAFITPSDKSSILFVDNSGRQPEWFGHKLQLNYKYSRDTVFNTDSLSDFVLRSVSKQVLNKGFFSTVKICGRQDNKFRCNMNDKFLDATLLTPMQVTSLSDSAHVDILVSLDRMVIQSKTNIKPFNYLFMATRDVSLNTVWRIFDVKADTLLTQFQYNDSLYWEKYSTKSFDAVKNELPKLEERLPEIAEVLGERISPILSPHWESVSRPYFSSGSYRMLHAVDCIRQDDWEGAAILWKDEFDKGFGKSVYHAAMNMILYAEYLQNPNEALVWCEKAEKAMKDRSSRVTVYDRWLLESWKQILKVRSAEFEMLKIYLNDPKN